MPTPKLGGGLESRGPPTHSNWREWPGQGGHKGLLFGYLSPLQRSLGATFTSLMQTQPPSLMFFSPGVPEGRRSWGVDVGSRFPFGDPSSVWGKLSELFFQKLLQAARRATRLLSGFRDEKEPSLSVISRSEVGREEASFSEGKEAKVLGIPALPLAQYLSAEERSQWWGSWCQELSP